MHRIFTDWAFDAALLLTIAGGLAAYLRPEWRETIARVLAGLLPLVVGHLGEHWHGEDKPRTP